MFNFRPPKEDNKDCQSMSDESFGPFFNEETFSSVKPLIENTSEVVQQVNGKYIKFPNLKQT